MTILGPQNKQSNKPLDNLLKPSPARGAVIPITILGHWVSGKARKVKKWQERVGYGGWDFL